MITRKARFEVWPEGSAEALSQHNHEREAIEAAQKLAPGTHEVRVGGAVYLEVVNADAGLKEVERDGVRHVLIQNLTIMANGKEQQATCPITWEGGPVELWFDGRVIGRL